MRRALLGRGRITTPQPTTYQRLPHAELQECRGRDCLSRRRRGRPHYPRARLRLHQGRELGLSDLGVAPAAGGPPRHRVRSSRTRRVDKALRRGGLPHRHDGRRRAGADGSSRHRAAGHHGLFARRAHHGFSCTSPRGARSARHLRRHRHWSDRRRRAGRERCEGARSSFARRASPTRWAGRSAPLPIRRDRIAARWPRACAAPAD